MDRVKQPVIAGKVQLDVLLLFLVVLPTTLLLLLLTRSARNPRQRVRRRRRRQRRRGRRRGRGGRIDGRTGGRNLGRARRDRFVLRRQVAVGVAAHVPVRVGAQLGQRPLDGVRVRAGRAETACKVKK